MRRKEIYDESAAAGLSGLSPANFIAPSAVPILWGYFVHLICNCKDTPAGVGRDETGAGD